MTELITTKNFEQVLTDITNAFWDIPFENTDFQTENFVIASGITPQRAYRAIGLQLTSRLEKLQSALYNKELRDIEIDELQYKINDPATSIWDKKRHELKLKSVSHANHWENKLLNDLINEINLLYKHFKASPKFTREEFEQGEKYYYIQKLQRDVNGLAGAPESLINLEFDRYTLDKFQNLLESGTVNTTDYVKLYDAIQSETQLERENLMLGNQS